jgi:hypothetical protein
MLAVLVFAPQTIYPLHTSLEVSEPQNNDCPLASSDKLQRIPQRFNRIALCELEDTWDDVDDRLQHDESPQELATEFMHGYD